MKPIHKKPYQQRSLNKHLEFFWNSQNLFISAIPSACDTCQHFCHAASMCQNVPNQDEDWTFSCTRCNPELGYQGTGKSCRSKFSHGPWRFWGLLALYSGTLFLLSLTLGQKKFSEGESVPPNRWLLRKFPGACFFVSRCNNNNVPCAGGIDLSW